MNDETEGKDLAQETLLDTLDGLMRSIQERGVNGISMTKLPCHDEPGVEHWTVQVALKPKTAKTAPTFVPAEAPIKPS